MAADAFDPAALRPDASLNRTCIAPLPGAVAAWVGRPAHELLSLRALKELRSPDPALAADAVEIFGKRLAHLIATLRTGAVASEAPASEATPSEAAPSEAALEPASGAASEPASSAAAEDGSGTASGAAAKAASGADSDWRRAYLQHWTRIERVWLGGGIAAALGPELAHATRAELLRLQECAAAASQPQEASPAAEVASHSVPVASHERLVASHERLGALQERSGTSNGRTAVSHATTQAPQERAGAWYRTSGASHEGLTAEAAAAEAPRSRSDARDEASAASRGMSAASQDLAVTSHEAFAASRASARASEQDAAASHGLRAASCEPAATEDEFTAASNKPVEVSHPSAEASHESRAASYEPAAWSNEAVAASGKSGGASRQNAAASHESAVASHKPVAASHEPASVSCEPSAASHGQIAVSQRSSSAPRRRAAAMRTSSGACAVELAPDAAWLPLLGAARSLPRPVRAANAVVFDFGHTQVKRGIASTNAHGQLRKLRVLSPVTVWSAANAAGSGNARIPEFVMSVVADTYREARRQYGHLDPRVVISLASYLVDAWPGPAPSLYAALRVFDRPALEKALCSRAEADLEVTFIHDGTAAAQAIAESASDAVILLGTSLGVGLGANFNPGSDARLSLASGFTVEVA